MSDNPPGRPPSQVSRVREREALALRVQGLTQDQIAERLGLTQGAVSRTLARLLGNFAAEMRANTPKLVALEVERLDAIASAIWPYCVGGPVLDARGNPRIDPETGEPLRRDPDPAYLAQFWKLAERRAKLLGLDVGSKVELSGPGGAPMQHALVDLTKLSPEQLAALETIMTTAGARASDAPAIKDVTATVHDDAGEG